jgi:hypothetical protein
VGYISSDDEFYPEQPKAVNSDGSYQSSVDGIIPPSSGASRSWGAVTRPRSVTSFSPPSSSAPLVWDTDIPFAYVGTQSSDSPESPVPAYRFSASDESSTCGVSSGWGDGRYEMDDPEPQPSSVLSQAAKPVVRSRPRIGTSHDFQKTLAALNKNTIPIFISREENSSTPSGQITRQCQQQ